MSRIHIIAATSDFLERWAKTSWAAGLPAVGPHPAIGDRRPSTLKNEMFALLLLPTGSWSDDKIIKFPVRVSEAAMGGGHFIFKGAAYLS